MGTIKQAVYGDEETSTDITDSLVKMFNKNKKYIELKVGPDLLETKEKGTPTTLSQAEKEEIRKQALESCGNGLDDACMKSRQESLRASKLEEKAREEASESIVGERLTVTVVDAKGKEKKLVIPKDNEFKFGRPAEPPSELSKFGDEMKKLFTYGTLTNVGGAILTGFLWAFFTALTWVALARSYTLPDGGIIDPGSYWWLKYLGTAISLISAGWGGVAFILITFAVLASKHFINKRSLLFTKQ